MPDKIILGLMAGGDPTVPLMMIALIVTTAFAFHMVSRPHKSAVTSTESPVALRDATPISTNDEDIDMDEQLSLIEAMERKDAILEQVADNNVEWLSLALEAMKQIPDGTVGIAEDFRFRLTEGGLKPPRHHNAWGAFMNGQIRRGALVWTGDEAAMRGKKAHGRRTKVYVKRTPGMAA